MDLETKLKLSNPQIEEELEEDVEEFGISEYEAQKMKDKSNEN